MEQANYSILGSEDIAELEQKYFPGESPLGLFRLCNVYMDSTLAIGDQSTVSTYKYWKVSKVRIVLVLESVHHKSFLKIPSSPF